LSGLYTSDEVAQAEEKAPLVVSAPTTGEARDISKNWPPEVFEAHVDRLAKVLGPEIQESTIPPAPSVGPLYCLQVASSPLGQTIQADVTLSDGRVVYAKGAQMVSFMEQAAQSQMPLDVVTETRIISKGPRKGTSLEGIIDVRKWESIADALEASIKAVEEQKQRTAVPGDDDPIAF
jgi:hypothetical protein